MLATAWGMLIVPTLVVTLKLNAINALPEAMSICKSCGRNETCTRGRRVCLAGDPEAGTGVRILQQSYESQGIRNLTRARRAVSYPVGLEKLRGAP